MGPAMISSWLYPARIVLLLVLVLVLLINLKSRETGCVTSIINNKEKRINNEYRAIRNDDVNDSNETSTTARKIHKSNNNISLTPAQRRPGTIFLHILGLEGTGHHFMKPMVKESPIENEIKDILLGPAQENLTKSFRAYLHQYCNDKLDEEVYTGNRTESIRLLQQIADKFNRRALTNFPPDYALYFPTLGGDDNSWPANAGPCRFMMYPNLDLFYDVCRAAPGDVQCGHVLQYRDPYAILRSTTRTGSRNFNRHILEGIHLYTTMLTTLFYQLTKYGDTTFGCVGILEPTASSGMATINKTEEMNGFGQLFGYRQTEWTQYMARNYRPQEVLTQDERDKVVPTFLNSSMQSLLDAHELVLNLCRKQCEINKCETSGYGSW